MNFDQPSFYVLNFIITSIIAASWLSAIVMMKRWMIQRPTGGLQSRLPTWVIEQGCKIVKQNRPGPAPALSFRYRPMAFLAERVALGL
jgi:hypothetical protein